MPPRRGAGCTPTVSPALATMGDKATERAKTLGNKIRENIYKKKENGTVTREQ